MKLEDFRSHCMRESENLDLDFDLRSSLGENFRKSDLDTKEISIKEIISLFKQTKNLLKDIENQSFTGKSLKFAGVFFSFNIIGTKLPNKQKLIKQFLPEKDEKIEELQSQIMSLKRKISIPSQVFTSFMQKYEESMLKSYKDHCCDSNFTNTKKIASKEIGDKKSWALLQKNYNQLKKHHEKCETVGRELQWQNIEAQLCNDILHKKIQGLLVKEGELGFRQSELLKLQSEYQENYKNLESKLKEFDKDQKDLDKEKRKLQRMKNLIRSQMDEIGRFDVGNVECKRICSASRLTENSPTLRRIRSHSRNESFDSEIEMTQNEISKLEVENNGKVKDVRLSKLYTKLSNLKTQKALERNSATSDSVQSVLGGQKDLNKKLNLSRDYSPRPEPSKPPTYRKTKINADSSQAKSLNPREKRISDKEAEVAVDQKQSEIFKPRNIKQEYENKLRSIQSDLVNSERKSPEISNSSINLSMTDEESANLHSRIKKLNELYSLIEEMI